MATVFDKLNLKDQTEIVVVNAPPSFEPELSRLRGVQVRRTPADVAAIEFSLAFVTSRKELDAIAKAVVKKAKGDAVVWFAYLKGTSKRFTGEITRDVGWDVLDAAGFEPVRLIAIDEDWSAKRVRRPEFIKSPTRDRERAMGRKS